MTQQIGRSALKKKSTHYFNSILITALALILLGVMGILFLSFRFEEKQIKEKIKISAFLKDNVNEADAQMLQKKIGQDEAVKSTEYISKEQAKEIVKEKFDEDITETLGDYNPLPASIDVYLNADMVNVDSIEVFQKKLEGMPGVKFTRVDEQLVGSIDNNFRVAGIIVALLCILFLVVAIAIIDKTIRLSMYANRFLIRSMQLVGATRSFVTRPYVRRSVANGIFSALLALAVLGIAIGIVQNRYHYWDFSDKGLRSGFFLMAVVLLGIGIVITWLSTRGSVHKYVKMKLDELY